MDDHEILQHLLNLESEASALVTGAQAEADRRAAEAEKQNRLRYDELYAAEVAALEKDFSQKLASVKEDYRGQLEAYRDSLKNLPFDTAAFFSLAEKFLLASPGGK